MGVGISCKNGFSHRLTDFVSGYSQIDERIRKRLGNEHERHQFSKHSTKSVLSKDEKVLFGQASSSTNHQPDSHQLEHTPSRLVESPGNGQGFQEQLNCAICDPDTYEPDVHKKPPDRGAIKSSQPSSPTQPPKLTDSQPQSETKQTSTSQESATDSIALETQSQPNWLSADSKSDYMAQTARLLDDARKAHGGGKSKSKRIEAWRSANELAQVRAIKSIERLDHRKQKFGNQMNRMDEQLGVICEIGEKSRSAGSSVNEPVDVQFRKENCVEKNDIKVADSENSDQTKVVITTDTNSEKEDGEKRATKGDDRQKNYQPDTEQNNNVIVIESEDHPSLTTSTSSCTTKMEPKGESATDASSEASLDLKVETDSIKKDFSQITSSHKSINQEKQLEMIGQSFSSLMNEVGSKIDSLGSGDVTTDNFDLSRTVAEDLEDVDDEGNDENIPGDRSDSVSLGSDRQSEKEGHHSFDSPMLIRGRPVSGSKQNSLLVQPSLEGSETPLLHHRIRLLDHQLIEQKHELIERMEKLFGQTNPSNDEGNVFSEDQLSMDQLALITDRDSNEIERVARSEALICADCGLCNFYDNDTFSRLTSDASELGSTSGGSTDLRWDELDQDVFELMHVLQRLTQILEEKERQLAVKRNLTDRMAVRKRVRQLKQRASGIGLSISKSMTGNRLIILRDGKCTYHIEAGQTDTPSRRPAEDRPEAGGPVKILRHVLRHLQRGWSLTMSNPPSTPPPPSMEPDSGSESPTSSPVSGAVSSAAADTAGGSGGEGRNSKSRKCKSATIQVDGRLFTIVANPPEANKNVPKDTSPTASNETIVIRKGPLKSLGSLVGDGSGQSGPSSQQSTQTAGLSQLSSLLKSEGLPPVDTLQACDKAAARLRELIRHLEHGEVSSNVLKKTLQYAACVLDTVSMDETRRPQLATSSKNANQSSASSALVVEANTAAAVGAAAALATVVPPSVVAPKTAELTLNLDLTQRRILDEEDDLSEVQPDAVPTEVREWLATTFTRNSNAQKKRSEDKPKFRSVANAIRAGIMVDKLYRRLYGPTVMQIPSNIAEQLKNIDNWTFDCFELNEVTNNQALKYITYELLNRYGLLNKFKIPQSALDKFVYEIEQGYIKYKNPYHNNMHAADVTQTVHYMLCQLGLMNWLSDIEIFATLFAAIIHDYQHTGTTNNFHVMSGTDTAYLYNDRSVLENLHLSTAFQVLRKEECNILSNLSKEEYREFRSLVIDMVLATDMSCHFQQIKTIKTLLTHASSSLNEEKSKSLSLILHCCDISHPSKHWNVHNRWTQLLIEEFFRQGDMERDLGLPYSPLCDRNTTLVAESQIGFIDFIVSPSMDVCGDLLDKIHQSIQLTSRDLETESKESDAKSDVMSASADARPRSMSSVKSKSNMEPPASSNNVGKDGRVIRPWINCLDENKSKWHERAIIDARIREQKRQQAEIEIGSSNL